MSFEDMLDAMTIPIRVNNRAEVAGAEMLFPCSIEKPLGQAVLMLGHDEKLNVADLEREVPDVSPLTFPFESIRTAWKVHGRVDEGCQVPNGICGRVLRCKGSRH